MIAPEGIEPEGADVLYRPQSRDTEPWADRMLFAYWRKLQPWQKAEIVSSLCRSLHELSMAGLRMRNPGLCESDLELLSARVRLGDELFERAFLAQRSRNAP